MNSAPEILKLLNTQGICVLPNYYPPEFCDQAVIDIDTAITRFSEKVEHKDKEGCGGDHRIYKMENQFETAHQFAKEKLFLEVLSSYKNCPITTHFTLGGKVEYRAGSTTNSGAGWHKDSGHEVQVKAMVYLTDTSDENGPFLFLPISPSFQLPTRDGNPNYTRYSDETIKSFCLEHNVQPVRVTGTRGTVILANTSFIHRGENIKDGLRYSYTNYCFENSAARLRLSEESWGDLYI